MAFYNNELYLLQPGKITKYHTSTLSKDEFFVESGVNLYPNPSDTFIQITGLKGSRDYKILDILGSELVTGIVSNNEKINIKELFSGLFFLVFENGSTFKFIRK